MDDWRHGGFGLYLHWPFCQSKCPYCDFNSHVASEIDVPRWQAAFLSELDRVAANTSGRVLDTVFFGGGTPSLMPPDLVHEIMDRIRRNWRTSNSFEVTLEANPSSVEAGRFMAYRDAGVSRVSMGMQAMNDTDLRALGRLHTVADAVAAFDIARQAFERVSFDLIYARQGQSIDDWRAELRRALDLSVDHLSLYQLTIEDGTAFGDRLKAGRLKGLPTEERAADLYEITQEMTTAAGLPAYEVSNHARPGAESRHNLIYWNSGDYMGVGPGAHGRLTKQGQRLATECWRMPAKWLDAVETGGHGDSKSACISPSEHLDEVLMMGLRTTAGISRARLTTLDVNGRLQPRISNLHEMGMLELDKSHLRPTLQGRMVLNAVLETLLSEG